MSNHARGPLARSEWGETHDETVVRLHRAIVQVAAYDGDVVGGCVADGVVARDSAVPARRWELST